MPRRCLHRSHFPVPVLRTLPDELNLRRGQVEQRVNAAVEIGLQPHDFRGELVVLIAALGQPRLPRVAFFQGDVLPEDLLYFAAESREIEIPPGGEFLVETRPASRPAGITETLRVFLPPRHTQ